MQDVQAFVGVANTVTLVCGGFVTLLALRASRRTGSTALRSLAVGLGAVTAGAAIAGVLYHATAVTLATAIAVHSGLSAVGFALLAHSLYAEGGVVPGAEEDAGDGPSGAAPP